MNDPPASPQDPAYRAIGRFMVEFSKVIYVMQTEITLVVGSVSPGLPVRALQVAVAQVTSASDLANMFFGVCTTVADLTDEEKQVRNKLRKRVGELVERRNDIAHGTWAIGVSEEDRIAWDRTVLTRDKAAKEGLKIGNLLFTVDELEALADEARDVAGLVMNFGAGCATPPDGSGPRHRVSDRLEVVDDQVRHRALGG